MPIAHFGSNILIAHTIVGDSPTNALLGDMSVEMAIYLEAKSTELELREAGDRESILGITNFFGTPQMRSLYSRGYNAGFRGYQPILIDSGGNLTELGREKALSAKDIVAELNDYRPNFAYEPHTWTEADEIILTANIPVRAVRLLRIMNMAISATEQAYAANAMSRMLAREKEREDKTDITNNLVKQDEAGPVGRRMIMMEELELHSQTPDVELKPEIFDIGSGVTQAYVPTATFGQRARTDLRYLIKLGLVDLRAYVQSGRGRPKHVVRVSIPGERVLTTLVRKNIL